MPTSPISSSPLTPGRWAAELEGIEEQQRSKTKDRSKFGPMVSSGGEQTMSYVKPEIVDGIPTIKMAESDVDSSKWRFSVVGQFIVFEPSLLAFKSFVELKWKEKGLLEVQRMTNGLFVLRFQGESEKQAFLDQSPIRYGNKLMYLRLWKQEHRMCKMDLTKLPVWVRFLDLGLQYYSIAALSKLASAIGVPLYADQATLAQDRIDYARVCLEISSTSTLPESVSMVDEFGRNVLQPVVYECMPDICPNCKVFGHKNCAPKENVAGVEGGQHKVKDIGEDVALSKRGTVVEKLDDNQKRNGIGGDQVRISISTLEKLMEAKVEKAKKVVNNESASAGVANDGDFDILKMVKEIIYDDPGTVANRGSNNCPEYVDKRDENSSKIQKRKSFFSKSMDAPVPKCRRTASTSRGSKRSTEIFQENIDVFMGRKDEDIENGPIISEEKVAVSAELDLLVSGVGKKTSSSTKKGKFPDKDHAEAHKKKYSAMESKKVAETDNTHSISSSKCTINDNENSIPDLIGCRIKVWWPNDKAFYEGVLKFFDSEKKEHVIVYDDGDVEILRLDEQCWVFLDNGKKSEMKHPKKSITASYRRGKSRKVIEEEIMGEEVSIEETDSEKNCDDFNNELGAIVPFQGDKDYESGHVAEGGDGEDNGSEEDGESDDDDGAMLLTRSKLNVFEYELYDVGHDHVSKHLKLKTDRGPLKCKQYTSKVLRWDLTRESNAMKEYVTKSGLHPLRVSSYKTVNRVVISAFVERWHPETTSFHMPFGEMTITLEDVEQILRLPITGKPMKAPTKNYNEMSQWVFELLGIDLEKVQMELKKNKCNALRTQWVIDNLSVNGVDRCEVQQPVQAARGYLLVLLGCTLFQDRTGDKVRTKYLHFLENMDNISEWAWGAGTLAYLYRMLGKASTFPAKAITGYLTLLEAWIYERFVNLRPGQALQVPHGELITKKWKGGSQMGDKNAYINMKYLRGELDALTKDDVNWTPYRTRDAYPNDVVWFFGCLSLDNIIEPYQPNRVVRQFGRIQDKPCAPICPKFSSRKKTNAYVARYDNQDAAFLNYNEYLVDEDTRGAHAKMVGECTREYEDWYTSVALVKLNEEIPHVLFEQRKTGEGDIIHKAIELVENYIAKGVKMTRQELVSGYTKVLNVLQDGSYKSGNDLVVGGSSKDTRRE